MRMVSVGWFGKILKKEDFASKLFTQGRQDFPCEASMKLQDPTKVELFALGSCVGENLDFTSVKKKRMNCSEKLHLCKVQ